MCISSKKYYGIELHKKKLLMLSLRQVKLHKILILLHITLLHYNTFKYLLGLKI